MENPSPQKGEAAAKAKIKTKKKVLVEKEETHGEVVRHRRKEEKAEEAKGKIKAKIEAAQSREEAMRLIPLPTHVKPTEENPHQERPTSRFADLGLQGPAKRANNAISATLECASIT